MEADTIDHLMTELRKTMPAKRVIEFTCNSLQELITKTLELGYPTLEHKEEYTEHFVTTINSLANTYRNVTIMPGQIQLFWLSQTSLRTDLLEAWLNTPPDDHPGLPLIQGQLPDGTSFQWWRVRIADHLAWKCILFIAP